MIVIMGLMVLNFVISWWNARTVGRIWSESKELGGMSRVLAVSGYIMSIAGFTIVYVNILLMLISVIGPYTEYMNNSQSEMLSSLISDLSYVLIITAVLPTGMIIWINSLITFWKRKSLRTGGVALYNTFATLSNTVSAVRNVPSALQGIKRALSNNERGSGNVIIIAIIVVSVAVLGGYFTASSIMRKADRNYDLGYEITKQKLAN